MVTSLLLCLASLAINVDLMEAFSMCPLPHQRSKQRQGQRRFRPCTIRFSTEHEADDRNDGASPTQTTLPSSPPPPVVTADYTPPSFASWDDLLKMRTRSGRRFDQVPRFVEFCKHHEAVAMANGGSNHIPNLLQGGAAAGPLAYSNQNPGQVVRLAAAWPGLTATPFPELDVPYYKHDDLLWVHKLQAHLPEIVREVQGALASIDESWWQSLRTRKGREWSDETGWAHLALIDNFCLNPQLVATFPKTMHLLDTLVGTERPRIGPRLCAIARQVAHSGIAEHCDYMNFHWTLHTALWGPAQGCGIIVNGQRRDWIVGQPLVVDTTFAHSTYNETDEDLYLLIVDFWHPDLSRDEIDTMRTFLAMNSGV